MKRIKKGKKYLIAGKEYIVNCMFKDKIVFFNQADKEYLTLLYSEVKAMNKNGTIQGV